jgi:hypothetical protein
VPGISRFERFLRLRGGAKSFESGRAGWRLARHEPDELPGCSTPQKHHNTQLRFFRKRPFAGLSLSLPDELFGSSTPRIDITRLGALLRFPGARLVPQNSERPTYYFRFRRDPTRMGRKNHWSRNFPRADLLGVTTCFSIQFEANWS